MAENKRKKGTAYEEKAVQHLQEQGYKIITTNYRCTIGEIDVIAKHEGILVFIEVKYRANKNQGFPAEAVNIQKQRKITLTAMWYLKQHRQSMDIPIRFDVVSILGETIQIYTNAFEASSF